MADIQGRIDIDMGAGMELARGVSQRMDSAGARDLASQMSGILKPTMNELTDSLERVMESTKEKGGGILSGLMSVKGIGIVAAITTGVKILSMISDNIAKMKETLMEASPTFKGMQEILDKQFNLALKPIGDIMAMLMRPYLQIMMNRLRMGMGAVRDIREAMQTGEISREAGVELIQAEVEDMLKGFAQLGFFMKMELVPIQASIAGFQQGLELATFDLGLLIQGFVDWTGNLFKGLQEGMGPIEEGLGLAIYDAVTAGDVKLEDLPSELKTAFRGAATKVEAMKEMTSLAGDITGEMVYAATSDEALEDAKSLSDDIIEDILNNVKDNPGTEYTTFVDDILNWIKGLLGMNGGGGGRFIGGIPGIGPGGGQQTAYFRPEINLDVSVAPGTNYKQYIVTESKNMTGGT